MAGVEMRSDWATAQMRVQTARRRAARRKLASPKHLCQSRTAQRQLSRMKESARQSRAQQMLQTLLQGQLQSKSRMRHL